MVAFAGPLLFAVRSTLSLAFSALASSPVLALSTALSGSAATVLALSSASSVAITGSCPPSSSIILIGHNLLVARTAACTEDAMMPMSVMMKPALQALFQVHLHVKHLIQQSFFAVEHVVAKVHSAIAEMAVMMVVMMMPVTGRRGNDAFQFTDHRLQLLLFGPQPADLSLVAVFTAELLETARAIATIWLFALCGRGQEHRHPEE
jgi:hypothetical protein